MKRIDIQRSFTTEEYSDLVKKVAEMVGRPFIQVFKMVEKLEPGQLDALYTECKTKWRERGFNSPAHMFWTERKRL